MDSTLRMKIMFHNILRKVSTSSSELFDNILRGASVVISILIWVMILLVWFQVIARNLTTLVVPWTLELAEWSLLYICFVGAAWVLKNEGHVKIDIALNYLNQKNQALLNGIMSIVGAIICLIITWYSAVMTWGLFQLESRIVSVLDMPKGVITVIIPIGSFCLFIQFLRRAYSYLGFFRRLPQKKPIDSI